MLMIVNPGNSKIFSVSQKGPAAGSYTLSGVLCFRLVLGSVNNSAPTSKNNHCPMELLIVAWIL